MFCCLWLQCIQKYKTKSLKGKGDLSLFADWNLCAVNIQKAFMELVMIFESGFFVVLTASHLKLNLENVSLILFTTFKIFCEEMKKILYDLPE